MKKLKWLLPIVLILGLGGWLVAQWWTQPRYDGDTLRAWLARLEDDEPAARLQAVVAVARFPLEHAQVVPALLKVALHDADAGVRAEAGKKLAAFCHASFHPPCKRQAAEGLLEGMSAASPDARIAAATVLIELFTLRLETAKTPKGAKDMKLLRDEVTTALEPRVLTLLVAALGDPDARVRGQVLAELATVRRPLGISEAKLLELAAEGDTQTKQHALLMLTKRPALSEKAIPVLLAGLQLSHPVWSACNEQLRRQGEKAVAPLFAVVTESTPKDEPNAMRAVNCLRAIGKPAEAAMLTLLHKKDARLRRYALSYFDSQPTGTAVMIELLKEEDAALREDLLAHLVTRARRNVALRAALRTARTHEHPRISAGAQEVITRLEAGPTTKKS